MHMLPFIVPALFSLRRWRRHTLITFQPFLHIVAIKLLVPKQASKSLPEDKFFIVGKFFLVQVVIKHFRFLLAISKHLIKIGKLGFCCMG